MVMRILTVGDGDMSCSLSLKRAYGSQIDLVASTLLPSEDQLIATYPYPQSATKETLTELVEKWGVLVRYGVDAMKLDRTFITASLEERFDLILFHHPHLGYDSSHNDYSSFSEQEHAQRHQSLLAHYLSSAQSCLSTSPRQGQVHLCLCGTQQHTWKLEEIVKRLGLTMVKSMDASKPILPDYLRIIEPHNNKNDSNDKANTNAKAPRRFRNGGKLGSRHWLGKYGYRHQATNPDSCRKPLNVMGSRHFFFQLQSDEDATNRSNGGGGLCCDICGVTFSSLEELQKHQASPSYHERKIPPVASLSPIQLQNKNEEQQQQCQLKPADVLPVEVICHHHPHSPAAFSSSDDRNAVVHLVVPEDARGKRLRWYLQHHHHYCRDGVDGGVVSRCSPSTTILGSKRQLEKRIQNGMVKVNGCVIMDAGRLLTPGDKVGFFTCTATTIENNPRSPRNDDESLQEETTTHEQGLAVVSKRSTPPPPPKLVIRIIDSWSDTIHVVDKPVGLRSSSTGSTRGKGHVKANNFDVGISNSSSSFSLEDCFSRQQGIYYVSRSRLDRGCSGLSVMQSSMDVKKKNAVTVTHSFVALVHGHARDWIEQQQIGSRSSSENVVRVNLPIESVRRWKKKQKVEMAAEEHLPSLSKPTTAAAINVDSSALIELLEQTDFNNNNSSSSSESTRDCTSTNFPALSTLLITTQSPVSSIASVICFFLRTSGHAVVGDRFVTREYLTLPRFVRNRLKQKLCLGCVAVEAKYDSIINDDSSSNNNNGCRIAYSTKVEIPDKWRASYWQVQVLLSDDHNNSLRDQHHSIEVV